MIDTDHTMKQEEIVVAMVSMDDSISAPEVAEDGLAVLLDQLKNIEPTAGESEAVSAVLREGAVRHDFEFTSLSDDEFAVRDLSALTDSADDLDLSYDPGFDVGENRVGDDFMLSPDLVDSAPGSLETNAIYGTEFDDRILMKGSADDHTIFGLGGDDILVGGAGNDVLFGGDGNDRLMGGLDDDVMFGDAGDDVIFGGKGNDVAYGGDGNDRLIDSVGADEFYGGPGDDVFVFNARSADGELNIIHDFSGNDLIDLSAFGDVVQAYMHVEQGANGSYSSAMTFDTSDGVLNLLIVSTAPVLDSSFIF